MSAVLPRQQTADTSAQTSSRWKAVAGFLVAGAALYVLADFQPQFAVGTAALIGLGVALTHTNEIDSLVSTWRGAVGI